jgi:Protein of unknown function (DUF3570)
MKNVSIAVASASALLLAQHTPDARALESNYKEIQSPWVVDSGLLYYKEKDRISATKPVVGLSRDYGDERLLNLKFVFDSLTGASPNGAAPASVPQTFTSASGGRNSGDDDDDDDDGGGPTVTRQNKLPTVGFKDTRVAFAADWSQPLTTTIKGTVGANFSHEYDYTSAGGNGGLSHDFNEKRTTLSIAASYQSDRINPIGGTPNPLADAESTSRQGSKKKTVSEVVFGLTQILNPYAFYQLSFSKADSNGYMTDPYKLLTLLDANNQLIAKPNTSDTYTYLYESRPNQRARNAIYNRIKYQVHPRVILDLSQRYTSDDWGIKTNTIDSRVRLDFGERKFYVEPHYRLYKQSKADFYAPYLVQGHINQYASADSRLGAFAAKTVGVKVGWNMTHDQEISLTAEQYKQLAARVDAPPTGPLAGQKMQPDLTAFIAHISYRFSWK